MRILLVCLVLALAACGGGGGSSPTPPQTPPPTGIGAAGGTVSNGGAQVVIPAGALAQSTAIAIEQTEVGAPALPAGVQKFGPMFAFTPHGTTFNSAVTMTLPYDPALVPAGTQVQFYKTDASQSSWVSIPVTSTGPTSITADVTGFSYAVAGGTPALARDEPDRLWIYEKFLAESEKPVATEDQDGEDNHKIGGIVDDEHDYGPLPFNFNGDTNATGAVFSSQTGGTYWVFAQGAQGSIKTPGSTIGNRVTLVQKQGFKKNRADARLKLHVTKVFIEAVDANGQQILYPECPTSLECGLTITGSVTFDVKAYRPFITPFFSGKSAVRLFGYQQHWDARNKVVIDGREQLWGGDVFEFDNDAGGFGTQQHAIFQLKEPVTIEIDISHLDVGVPFTLWVEAVAETNNHRQRESYVAAFFRDPISTEGAEIETFGLDPVAGPFADPVPDEPQAPECTSGDEASAGTLQFAAATFLAPEMAQAFTQVEITRTGGTVGAVSAKVRTQDDTALAGDDYEAVNTSVYFGPGDDASRILEVPLTLDDVAESDKSLTVTLSAPRGCAVIGTQASATLTILDDDRPEPPPPPSGLDEAFGSQGKTILAGFGDETDLAIQADGKIVMVGGKFIDFVLARFNADGTLDTAFGNDGKVTTDLAGGFAQERARAVAIQSDGKIVVAGETTSSTGDVAVALVRYNADGTLDSTFGNAGKVFGSVIGRAFDVAVQPDGRIVVAGDAPVPNVATDFGDFLLARFEANGTLDTTFGTVGVVVQDMTGSTDLARNLVLQPDGALVVSGDPFGSDPSRRTSIARYTASGQLDASFAGGGKLIIGGAYVGEGLALYGDGRLVLVGSSPVLNVQNDVSHFAALRLNADGTFDDSFGDSGIATTSITGLTDVAHAVVVQPDGKVVVAGEGNLINPNFTVVRYDRNGDVDTTFAVDGKLVVDFAGLADRAENVGLQSDGKIIAGGLATARTAGYGVIRVHR